MKTQQLNTYGMQFIAIQSYIREQEKHRVDNLTLHLKQLEKQKKNQNY